MASFKSKIVKMVMKHRHLLKGKWKREVVDFSTSIEKYREDVSRTAAKMARLPEGVKAESSEFDGFYSEWIVPDGCSRDKVILYFHGGGFVSGTSRDHRSLVSKFSKRCGVKCLVFDYSLAPEKPFPAAVNDSVEIYTWLLKSGYQSRNIMFAGDSAGAGIEISTALMLREKGADLPAAIVAMSPCADMTCSGESNITKRDVDPCSPEGANETFTSYYTGNHDPKDPLISPVFADFTGMCPIMIQVGEDETLLDDSVRLAKRMEESGAEVVLHVWKDMFHCFPMLAPLFREADEAMEEICGFIKKHLGL